MQIGLIGYGNMGKIHARVLDKLNVLSHIIEPFEKNRKLAEEQYNCKIHSDIEEIQDDLDGVIIAVPTQYHSQIFEKVVNKFPDIKGILIEKPVIPTYEEYHNHKDLFEKYKDKIIVGHIEVYNPIVSKLIEIVNSKEYGSIRHIEFHRKGSVASDRISSLAGIVEDIGIHDVDIMLRMVDKIESVYGTGNYVQGNLNSARIIAKGNNFDVFFNLSREFAGRKRMIEVELEKATIEVDLIAQTMEIRGLTSIIGTDETLRIPHGVGSSIKAYGEPLFEELSNLLDIIRGDKKPVVGFDHALACVKLIDQMNLAIEQNTPIKVKE